MFQMFSKDMVIGILLSSAKMNLSISLNEEAKIGYSVKLSLDIRGKKEFLVGLHRSLIMQGIESNLKDKEQLSRPKPILKITGKYNLWKVKELVPNLPDSNGEWKDFVKCVELMNENKHLTLDGLEIIMKIKGVL